MNLVGLKSRSCEAVAAVSTFISTAVKPFNDMTPVAAWPALALAIARNERLHLLPLIIPQNLAFHR